MRVMAAVEHKLWVCDVCGPLIVSPANAKAKPARCVGCGRKARAYVRADTCRGAVDRLEALRPLVNACGDGELNSPWNTDALVKLAKGVRATLGGQ